MRLVRIACAFLTVGCLSIAARAADPLSGVTGSINSGGGVSGSVGGGLSGAARLQHGAGVRVGGASGAGARPVGPNFNPARLGADARLGAGAGKSGVRAGASLKASTEMGKRNEKPDSGRSAANRPSEGRPTEGSHDPAFQAAMRADLALATRLAEIDRLRDIALTKGDADMLVRADALEREARLQHEHRVRNTMSATEARENAEFGLSTAARAREEGREFGQSTAARARDGARQADAEFEAEEDARARAAYNRGRGPYDQGPPRGELETRADERARFNAEIDPNVRGRGPYDQGPPRGKLETRADERARYEIEYSDGDRFSERSAGRARGDVDYGGRPSPRGEEMRTGARYDVEAAARFEAEGRNPRRLPDSEDESYEPRRSSKEPPNASGNRESQPKPSKSKPPKRSERRPAEEPSENNSRR